MGEHTFPVLTCLRKFIGLGSDCTHFGFYRKCGTGLTHSNKSSAVCSRLHGRRCLTVTVAYFLSFLVVICVCVCVVATAVVSMCSSWCCLSVFIIRNAITRKGCLATGKCRICGGAGVGHGISRNRSRYPNEREWAMGQLGSNTPCTVWW